MHDTVTLTRTSWLVIQLAAATNLLAGELDVVLQLLH